MRKRKVGRKYMGWQVAFERLKEEHIKVSCMLLEMADYEAHTPTRDEIYAYLKRTPFFDEVLARHEAEMYLGNSKQEEGPP